MQQYSNASGCKNEAENIGSGTRGWGNSVPDRPFSKVNAGTSRFKDIVEIYGKTEDKDILIQELLSLLKWDKRLGPTLDQYFNNFTFMGLSRI